MTSARGGCAPQFFHIIAIQFVGVSLYARVRALGLAKTQTAAGEGEEQLLRILSTFCHWAPSCERLKSRSCARLFTPWLIRRTFVCMFERTHGIQSPLLAKAHI
jgi:hypothetical protein